MKHSLTGHLLITLILATSATAAQAERRHHYNEYHQGQEHRSYNEHHRQGKGRVQVTKEVTRDGVIIHKTITKPNGETYTIDKEIGKGRHGHVDIEKKHNGRVIHREHHQR